MKVGPVFLLAALPGAALAQIQASLGVGVGTVRYAGGSSFSAATLAPAAQLLRPSSFLGASGSLSALPDGVWAEQGRADLWAAVPRDGLTSPYLAVNVGVAASGRSDGVAAAAATALGELTLTGARGGVALGAGAVSGVIEQERGITALRLRARGWWQPSAARPQLSLSVESTRFLGAWYTDVLAGGAVDRGRLVASLWATARFSSPYGSKGAVSAALQYFATPALAVELGAGSYLSDPFQGLPPAGYISAGIRLHATPRRLTSAPVLAPRLAPLVASRRGDSVVVRFQMAAARSVAIAGDWNAWRPTALRPLGGDIWEGAFVLAPGTYHFNLLVDDTEWVVPGGVAVVSDGMGGLVAVLTVL
jgi:hypothetical protein